MARLSLSLLGAFAVTLDNRPLTGFAYDKVRALLTYLAVEAAHSHRRAPLCALLWPESPPDLARQSLSQALHNLRRLLDGEHAAFLLVDRHEVRFHPACDLWLDTAEFQRLAGADPGAPTPAALESWAQAVALYRGPFLAGFSLPDAAPFEEWALLQREWLQRLALETLRRLVAGWRDHNDPERALDYAWRLVELEPWEEEAHRQIMQLLVACGRTGEALAQYERCRRILLHELGVDPQPETMALHAAILQGQTPDRPAALDPPALPLQATPFIGRERELAQVARCLADPACRLLTVVGPGGIGKTRLALQAAQQQTGRFAHGICFVDLAPVASADLLPTTILHTLHAPRRGTLTPAQQLLRCLHDRKLLLLLDNCEHLLEGMGLLPELLQAAPHVKLLVTSRERLNLQEERLLPLEGLALPPVTVPGADRHAWSGPATGDFESGPPVELERYSATRLFLDCVHRVRPGFHPTPAETAHIARICQLLEGMPLAIELAAAWTRTLPVDQIAHAMAGSLAFLSTSLRDIPPRHRSMHAAFDHSWRLLSPREQALLCQLAVFRGGFNREAAAAVAGATLAGLAGLVDASWLRATPTGRYAMHELVRQYCLEKLDQEHQAGTGEAPAQVQARHAAYFGGFLKSQEQGYNWQRQAIAGIMPESGNILAAWNWAVEQVDVERIDQIAMSLYFIAEMEGWYASILEIFDAVVRRLDQSRARGADQAAPLLALIHYARGQLYAHLGLLEKAQACVDEGQAAVAAIAGIPKQEEWRVWMQQLQARLLSLRGDSAGAVRLEQEALSYLLQTAVPFWPYLPEIGTRFVQAHLYAALGREKWVGGDYAEAERLVRQALALREQMGERRFRAFNQTLLARILLTTGDYPQAETFAQDSLHLSLAFGDKIGAASAHLALGRIDHARGHLARGRAACRQCLDVARRSGDHSLLMGSLAELGRIELALGHATEAKRLLDEARAAFQELGTAHSNHLVAVLVGTGWAALAGHDWPAAHRAFAQARSTAGATAGEVMETYAGEAHALIGEGQPVRAAALLAQVVASPTTPHATRQAAAAALSGLARSAAAAQRQGTSPPGSDQS